MPATLTFGRYRFIPFTWVMSCRSKEKQTNKKGEVKLDENGNPKRQSFKRSISYIYVEVLNEQGNGLVWVFVGTGTKNKPLTFSDSRDKLPNMGKAKRLTPSAVQAEICRMTSEAFAQDVMAAMTANHHEDERGNPGVAKQAVADLLGCILVPYTVVEDDEEYETTRMEGGLLARVQGHLLACKEYEKNDRKLKLR